MGEDGLEKGPSFRTVLGGRSDRRHSLSCGGLGSAHETLGDDGFSISRGWDSMLS